MKFKTEKEAKKWLRGIPFLKRELKLKIRFYEDLITDSRKMGEKGNKYIDYYYKKIDLLQKQLQELMPTVEELFEVLDPEERMILTARYIKGCMWDFIEFQVHYSRRQAVRIHDKAIKKLVDNNTALPR